MVGFGTSHGHLLALRDLNSGPYFEDVYDGARMGSQDF